MSTQGQGDVVERLRAAAREIRNDGTASQVGLSEQECEDIADEITRLRTLLSSSRGEQPVRVLRIGAIGDQRVRVIQEATNQGAPTFFLVDDGRIGFCQPDLIKPSKERVPWQTQTSSRGEQGLRNALDELLGACQRYDADPNSTLAIADYLEAKDHAAEVLAAAALQSSPQPTAGGDAPK